jgi:preprotein translocase subunit YajC
MDFVEAPTLAMLLMGPAPQGGEAAPGWVQLVPFALMALVFYFLLIAPERRRRKQTNEMLSNLKNGDRVITSGGLHGRVVGLSDQIIQLRIAEGVKIEVARSAVASKLAD